MKLTLERKEVETLIVEDLRGKGMPVDGKDIKMKFTANTVEVNITEPSTEKTAPEATKSAK